MYPESFTHVKISQLVASLQTSRQQVVFARLVTSCQQVWNKLLTTCNNLVDYCQTCYKVVPTRLLQSWYNNIATTLCCQPCNILSLVPGALTFCGHAWRARDIACGNLISSCEASLPISPFSPTRSSRARATHCRRTTCSKLVTTNQEQAVRTQLVNNLWTDLLQLVCRLVTTCAFLRVYLCTALRQRSWFRLVTWPQNRIDLLSNCRHLLLWKEWQRGVIVKVVTFC